MRKLCLAVMFWTVFSNIHPAAALSASDDPTSESMRQSGGAEQLADPDEEIPSYTMPPNDVATRTQELSLTAPYVNMPTVGDDGSSARAFDRTVEHQEDNQ